MPILLLELSGATLLLLDEPTDTSTSPSPRPWNRSLAAFEGSVPAVTHDRWFTRGFDRFLLFAGDGEVEDTSGAVWEDRDRARGVSRTR